MQHETSIFKENLLNALHSSVCLVVFTKKDGTNRTMECTLMSDKLPVRAVLTEDDNLVRAKNENQCRVYDLENTAWRSFNYDSVISFMVKA